MTCHWAPLVCRTCMFQESGGLFRVSILRLWLHRSMKLIQTHANTHAHTFKRKSGCHFLLFCAFFCPLPQCRPGVAPTLNIKGESGRSLAEYIGGSKLSRLVLSPQHSKRRRLPKLTLRPLIGDSFFRTRACCISASIHIRILTRVCPNVWVSLSTRTLRTNYWKYGTDEVQYPCTVYRTHDNKQRGIQGDTSYHAIRNLPTYGHPNARRAAHPLRPTSAGLRYM